MGGSGILETGVRISRQVPNMITAARLLLCAFVAYGFIQRKYLLAVIAYGLEELLDQADGKIASLLGARSETGRHFDPFVDTFAHLTAFAGFLSLDLLPLWMFLVILFRELALGFMRLLAESQGSTIRTHWPGQAKALLHASAIFFSLLTLATHRMYVMALSGWFALAVAASIFSGIIYLWEYRLVLRRAFAG